MDVADASGTLLLDVGARRWSAELLDDLGIPASWLPDLAESPDAVGTLDGAAIAAGSGDQAAAAVGAGITGPGPLSVVLGTSGVVLAATDRFLGRPQGRVHAFCHAVPDRWQVMGVMLSAAGSLAWFHDTLSAGARLRRDARPGRARPAGVGRPRLPAVPGRGADAVRRPGCARRLLRIDRSGTRARCAHPGGARGCRLRLRDCLDTVRDVGATGARGRVSGGGRREPPLAPDRRQRARDARSRSWRRTRDRRSGRPCSAGSPPACTATSTRRAAACVRVTEVVEPVDRVDRTVPGDATPAFATYYPALRSVS